MINKSTKASLDMKTLALTERAACNNPTRSATRSDEKNWGFPYGVAMR
jgi:hypothetical protein